MLRDFSMYYLHTSKGMRQVEVIAGGQALSPICVQRLPSSLVYDLSI